ncbi:hypothetical protein [Rhodococcus sp. EPR-157]|uniref:hypothetical protein n=1 Tax=Rhodococcus sp. EPR-157 TaxID=1813677 RepID=UPI000A688F23|nr:hypothetical protein [Rhodococcus sp. EPR-157]
MTRIGFADHLFLRMHHGIGNPVVNQFLWLLDTAVSGDDLEKLRTNLSRGLLARRVEPPTLPTARHRWVASTVSLPLELATSPLPSDTVLCWAEQRVIDDLDPEAGIGWQLAAAPLSGGGMVVSLVCSHMVADGAAMVEAIRRANSDNSRVDARDLGTSPSLFGGIVEDLGDTVGEAKPILQWVAEKVVATATSVFSSGQDSASGSGQIDPPRRQNVDQASGPWSPPYVVVECSAAEWHAAAAEWGGTSNSLFIGVMTAISEALGRAMPGDELRRALPYSDRDPLDIDSNSTKIIPVRVPVSDRQDRDLTRIRKASKAAFTDFTARQKAGTASPTVPLPLIQMLPDVVVARLPMPTDGAEGLCSNLGQLPEDFITIGGVRARSVAARATFAGADAAFARTLGGGSTAWATETDEAITITLHGMDPDRMVTDSAVRDVVADVLQRWKISHRFW